MRRIVLTAVAMLLPLGARANSIDLYGYGDRASSMGMAGTAIASGGAAAYYDPAGLVRTEGVEFVAGYRVAPTFLTLQGRGIGARDARATEIGLAFGTETFARRSGLAMTVRIPDAGLLGVRVRDAGQPDFVVVDTRRDRLHAMLAFGIEPIEKLAFGAGVSVFTDTVANVGIDFGDAPGAAMDASLKPTRTLHLGVLAGPFEDVRIGLAFRGEQISHLELPVTIHARVGGVSGDVLVRSTQFNYYAPAELALGAARDHGAWTLDAELLARRWSRMPDPGGTLSIDVVDPGGVLPAPPPLQTPIDPGFRDTVSPRAGVEWRTHAVSLRGGYAFEPSPAPRPAASRNLLDCDRHVFTAGAAIRVPKSPLTGAPLSLGVHGMWGHLSTRTVVRSDPTDPVGSYRYGGDLFSLGIDATISLDLPYLRRPGRAHGAHTPEGSVR